MSTIYVQTSLGGPNGTATDPHQGISNARRKLEQLRQKAVDLGTASKDAALGVSDRVRTVEKDLKDLRSFQSDITSLCRKKEELEELIHGQGRLVREYLDGQRGLSLPEVASKMPDKFGRLLMQLSSAYLGTQAYIDMAIAHSQQLPGDNITGPAAAVLAQQLEAVRADHERIISERDQTIRRLEADLLSAQATATASTALAQEHQSAAQKQARAARQLRESGKRANASIQELTSKASKQQAEIAALNKVAVRDVAERQQLSLQNKELTKTNEQLRQENEDLKAERQRSKQSIKELQSRLAYVIQVDALNKDRARGDIEDRDRAIRDIQTRLDKAQAETEGHDREALAKAAELQNAKEAAENEVVRLQTVLSEANCKMDEQAAELDRLLLDVQGRADSHRLQGERISSLSDSLREREKTNNGLELALQRAKHTCDDLETQHETLQAAMKRLEESLATTRKLAEDRKAEVTRLNELLAKKETEVGTMTLATERSLREVQRERERTAADASSKLGQAARVAEEKDNQISALKSTNRDLSRTLERVDRELAAYQNRAAEAERQAAADKESLEALQQMERTALDSLAKYFAAACATTTTANPSDSGWAVFARAAQTARLSEPDGPGPAVWTLEVWDGEVSTHAGPYPPAQIATDLYGALRAGLWTAQVAKVISLFTDAVAQAASVNVAIMQLVADESIRAIRALEPPTVSPTSFMCGLGLWQALSILTARWPHLLSTDHVQGAARHLSSLHVLPAELTRLEDLGQSPNRLVDGQMAFLAQHGGSVGFIVDAARCSIRAVPKTRSDWQDHKTVVVRAPQREQDVLIAGASQEALEWLVWHWLS